MKKKIILSSILALGVLGGVVGLTHGPVEVDASATSESIVNTLKNYYNDGVYTKKTQIDLTTVAETEIKEHFHGNVELNRSTYYKHNALLMGDFDGSFKSVNSGYGTDASGNMTHFTWNQEAQETEIDYTVTKGEHQNWKDKDIDGMEGFYVTLNDMLVDGYFDSWTSFEYSVINKNDKYLLDFLAFTAPCLESTFLSSNYFTATAQNPVKLKIQDRTDYLSLQIILNESNSGTVNNTSRILSDARIYKGNTCFEEENSYFLVVNNNSKHEMVSHTTVGEVKAEGINLVTDDRIWVENSFGWQYNKIKNPDYEAPFVAPHDGSYDFYYDTNALHTWVTVPAILTPD